MGRKVAMLWHALSSIGAGFLFFFFVLPRWHELIGDTSHGLGTALRIVTGVLIGLAALPVVFTNLRTRKPELGTPQLALTIRTWSIVAHVLAGVLIVGTAISELWLSLDKAGQWLFAVYGAAAAIAVLGFFAFYLSFAAELPPPPPKPIKPKKEKKRRIRGKKRGDDTDAEDADETDEDAADEDAADADAAEDVDTEAETVVAKLPEAKTVEAETASADGVEAETVEAKTVEAPVSLDKDDSPASEPATEDDEASAETVEASRADAAPPRLRNRRPTGKTSHRRRRTRGGVAVDE